MGNNSSKKNKGSKKPGNSAQDEIDQRTLKRIREDRIIRGKVTVQSTILFAIQLASKINHFIAATLEWDNLEKEVKENVSETGSLQGLFISFWKFPLLINLDNQAKNRYGNVKPLDRTRVVLKNCESDYINASWIDGMSHHLVLENFATLFVSFLLGDFCPTSHC